MPVSVELYKSGAQRVGAGTDLFTLKLTDEKTGATMCATLTGSEWSEFIAKPRIIIKD